jgi:hypothetical protein
MLKLSEDLTDQVKETGIRETVNFLQPASTLVALSSRIVSEIGFTLPENNGLEAHAIEILKAYPQFAMVNMADEKGNFLMSKRMPDGTIATKKINRNAAPAKTIWRYRDKPGQVIRTHRSPDDHSEAVREWLFSSIPASDSNDNPRNTSMYSCGYNFRLP